MITIKDGSPPSHNDIKDEIESVYNMQIGQEAEIKSDNYNSWKATFYQLVRKRDKVRKFKFKKIDENTYSAWRLT